MSLAVEVLLPDGRYEAAEVEDPHRVEWPPHPGRLHAALRASSCTGEHDKVLRWLETLPAPEVWAPLTHDGEWQRNQYVVTGRFPSKGGSQTHPGRVHQERRRSSALVQASRFAFVWPETVADIEQHRALDDLARRVPYWGRSSSPALCSVSEQAEWQDEWVRFVPCEPKENGAAELRVPFAGLTDELEQRYELGSSDWEAWYPPPPAGMRAYRPVQASGELAQPEPHPSGHEEMLVLAMPPGVRVDGLQAGALTSRLRKAVMHRVPDPLPPEVSGHGANGRPHIAYVPLPDVGHPHAQGHVLGAALLFPRGQEDLAQSVRTSVVGGETLLWLDIGGVRVDLHPVQGGSQPRQRRSQRLTPRWWRGPAQEWVTVTPLVLDRFPGRGGEEADIARHCQLLGLPEPCAVETSRSPLIPGGAKLQRRHLARNEDRPRPFTHARVRFPVPVAGPLVLGAQRHVGMGMCAPQSSNPWQEGES